MQTNTAYIKTEKTRHKAAQTPSQAARRGKVKAWHRGPDKRLTGY